jgi:leucyl-tRNA synthetase
VNGKVRDRIDAPAGKSEAELERLALASPKVQAALNGSKPAKVIVVADRLVNLVTKGPQERVTK